MALSDAFQEEKSFSYIDASSLLNLLRPLILGGISTNLSNFIALCKTIFTNSSSEDRHLKFLNTTTLS